jgi:hypothetical protein
MTTEREVKTDKRDRVNTSAALDMDHLYRRVKTPVLRMENQVEEDEMGGAISTNGEVEEHL